MGTKSFVQIEINAVFTTTSGKMQFRSGVFDHFKVAEYTCFFPKTYIKSVLIVKFNMSRCSGNKN
jgi:hypothetical protein